MRLITAAAALALCIAPAQAQDKISAQEFVTKAAQTDMFEIKSGEMAQENAEMPEVKQFGEQMVKDHTMLSNAMKQTIRDNNIDVKVPTELDAKHQKMIEELESADNFDRKYVQMNAKGHKQAVQLFENYSKNGDNEHLKKAAAKGLPTIKEHHQHARNLRREMKSEAKTNDNMKKEGMEDDDMKKDM